MALLCVDNPPEGLAKVLRSLTYADMIEFSSGLVTAMDDRGLLDAKGNDRAGTTDEMAAVVDGWAEGVLSALRARLRAAASKAKTAVWENETKAETQQ